MHLDVCVGENTRAEDFLTVCVLVWSSSHTYIYFQSLTVVLDSQVCTALFLLPLAISAVLSQCNYSTKIAEPGKVKQQNSD